MSVAAVEGSQTTGKSYLIAAVDQPSARRAADVTTLLMGAFFIVWGLVVFGKTDALEQALTQLATGLPQWAIALLKLGYSLGFIYVVVVVVILLVHRRWAAIRDVAIAGVAAGVVGLVLVAIYGELWPPFFTELLEGPVEQQFPVVRVALVVAILVAATPYLARPIRRLGWAIVIIVSVAAIALAISLPSGALVALGVGLVAAAGVHLFFGSPMGYPDTTEVRAAMNRFGMDVPDLKVDPDQHWGVRRFVGMTVDGVDVEVKAYGRDATDSQVMAKLWRSLIYRGGAHRITFSRIQSVEHEALVTIMADRSGVLVPNIEAASQATEEVAILVTTRSGTLLTDLDESLELDQQSLIRLWEQVAQMHTAGITHGNLGADSIRVTDDGFLVGDFTDGSLDYQESDTALDLVHLLFATAVLIGAERAVNAAAAGLGSERLATCLEYLQPPALRARDRHSTKGYKKLLTELQGQVAETVGVEVPEPIKLRRFGWKNLLTIVIVVLFLSALVPLLTGMDYAQMWATLTSANPWLLLAALVVGQLVFIPQGTAMMSAVGRAIPLRPMTILQPAITFISFAVPGVAGRMAMQTAFLHKYGVGPTAAVVKSAVDSFAGFLIQVAILVTALITGSIMIVTDSTTDSSSSDSSDSNTWLWVVAAIVVIAAIAIVVAVLKIKKLHDKVVPQIQQAWEAMTEVMRSPRRALGLLGSQLAVQLLWGLALWVALLALGVHQSLLSCTAIVVAAALLAGVIPVPGAIGVSAAIISALLIPLGVSAEAAMGAAVIYRLMTFYVPSTEGFFAARYLQKHGYL